MWHRRPQLKRDPDLISTTSSELPAKVPSDDEDADEHIPESSTKSDNKRKQACFEDSDEYLKRKHKFIKSTIRTDYQPDICKDYKETGFCGFGDSCKFLHDRSDYKHGWQLDQEWSKGLYKDEDDEKYLIKADEDDEDDRSLTHCAICNQPYEEPIITKCKHYFCINCAEKDCSEKCVICQRPTAGIFKNAKKILEASKEGKKDDK